MNETVLDEPVGAENAPRAAAVISVRSLLLRVLIAIVMVGTLSIGGAWLMNAAIDPTAEASEGVDTSIRDGAPSTQPGTAAPATR
jgi:hypothetical protein